LGEGEHVATATRWRNESDWLRAACCAAALAAAGAAHAGADECVKLSAKPGSDAVLTNRCSEWLNVRYCVDSATAARNCASKPKDIITLFPGDGFTLPGYEAEGRGAVHWAACMYPEAPVGWLPGPDSPYTCKKTCVMC
jgi:hypothetical protein